MTTKEAAKKWGCSEKWIRNRCDEGIIPFAEKHRIWEIPETADKPPCTRHRAVVLLKRIVDISKGLDVELLPGNNDEENVAIYRYLSEYGFMSKLKGEDIIKALEKAVVTEDGLELIKKEAEKKPGSKKTKINMGVNGKVFNASLEREYTE